MRRQCSARVTSNMAGACFSSALRASRKAWHIAQSETRVMSAPTAASLASMAS